MLQKRGLADETLFAVGNQVFEAGFVRVVFGSHVSAKVEISSLKTQGIESGTSSGAPGMRGSPAMRGSCPATRDSRWPSRRSSTCARR